MTAPIIDQHGNEIDRTEELQGWADVWAGDSVAAAWAALPEMTVDQRRNSYASSRRRTKGQLWERLAEHAGSAA